jgi:hypothetical protein
MKKFLILNTLLITSIFTFSQTENIEYKIYPIDETKNDSNLFLFVEDLKQILIEKDTFKLFKLLDERVVTSFGGAMYGKKDFVKNWDLDKSDSSEIWSTMTETIELGGVFGIGGVFLETKNDTIFRFPYVTSSRLFEPLYEQNPEYDFDPHFTLICLNKNVPLYKSSENNSEILTSLSYDVLSMDYDKTYQYMINNKLETFDWIYVSSIDNSISGWIKNGKDFYFYGGRTMIIEKYNNNKYKITGFFGYD